MNRQIPFDDIDKRQEKKQLKQRLTKAIRQLTKQLKNPGNQEKMMEFIGCLSYNGFTDVNRLPYYSADAPFCKSSKKVLCLFALVCAIVQNWWMYSQEDFSFEDMSIDVERLENLQLDKCSISGNIREGYYLES